MCMVGIWLCHIPTLHHYDRFPPGGNMTGGNLLVGHDIQVVQRLSKEKKLSSNAVLIDHAFLYWPGGDTEGSSRSFEPAWLVCADNGCWKPCPTSHNPPSSPCHRCQVRPGNARTSIVSAGPTPSRSSSTCRRRSWSTLAQHPPSPPSQWRWPASPRRTSSLPPLPALPSLLGSSLTFAGERSYHDDGVTHFLSFIAMNSVTPCLVFFTLAQWKEAPLPAARQV